MPTEPAEPLPCSHAWHSILGRAQASPNCEAVSVLLAATSAGCPESIVCMQPCVLAPLQGHHSVVCLQEGQQGGAARDDGREAPCRAQKGAGHLSDAAPHHVCHGTQATWRSCAAALRATGEEQPACIARVVVTHGSSMQRISSIRWAPHTMFNTASHATPMALRSGSLRSAGGSGLQVYAACMQQPSSGLEPFCSTPHNLLQV